MSDASKPDLAYESAPPGGGLTRRQGRWIILLLFLNTCFLGIYVFGPQLVAGLQKQWTDWQARRAAEKQQAAQVALRAQQLQQALATEQVWRGYEFPAGTVVYEEDPKLAVEYLISGKGYSSVQSRDVTSYTTGWQSPVVAPAPAAVSAVLAQGFVSNAGLLLVHERKTPSGQSRLVTVSLVGNEMGYSMSGSLRRVDQSLDLYASAFDPVDPVGQSKIAPVGSLWKLHNLKIRRPEETDTEFRDYTNPPELKRGPFLRFMAGTVDPKDPTHFTIPYRFGDTTGVVDGWLRDDAIELRPRVGQIGPESSWKLPAPAKR